MEQFQLSNRLLDRIATLNFNVIRCANEHPLKSQKYFNGGKVRVVIAPDLEMLIYDLGNEKDVVKALKEQFIGRLCDQDLGQIGFFNYKHLKLGWVIQAVKRGSERTLSEDVFDTKENIYWIIISNSKVLSKHNAKRIQSIKRKKS
tara:strand:+ start:3483 stop:3920 length:438 start_codon:yes stop_codon:yes gene_type:complete